MSINVKGIVGGAARVAAGAALLVAAGSSIAPGARQKADQRADQQQYGWLGRRPLAGDLFRH